MKKEEAIKMLSNTKVYVDGKSEEIQRKLFELGFMWTSNSKEVSYTHKPFIIISSRNMYLTTTSDMLYFRDDKAREIKADDILSITIDKEYQFKPFDKVLVREGHNCIWQGTFITHLTKNDTYGWRIYTVTGTWGEIIPFEGNEHLVGTKKSPDKV